MERDTRQQQFQRRGELGGRHRPYRHRNVRRLGYDGPDVLGVHRRRQFTGGGIDSNGSDVTIDNSGINSVIFDNSTAGDATINNNANAFLNFNNNGTAENATLNNSLNAFINFSNGTAGSATINNTTNSFVTFNDGSADNAVITNSSSGSTTFNGTSTAANAEINNSAGGRVTFRDNSTAATSKITNDGAGRATFRGTSTAASAEITNNSGGTVYFRDTSTAANAEITNNDGADVYFQEDATAAGAVITNSGSVNFQANSTAESAQITNNSGGTVQFYDTSTAANAEITNNNGGAVYFTGTSTADSAEITNSGGVVRFGDNSTADSAKITNSGSVIFQDTSTAGTAEITNNSGGTVDFSATSGALGDNKVSAASIAGAGNYMLGANELTVGTNDSSTEVSGGVSGTNGTLIKTGLGTLTLTGANSYSGGTRVAAGTLQVGKAGDAGAIVGTLTVDLGTTFLAIDGDLSGLTDFTNAGTTTFEGTTTLGATAVHNGSGQTFELYNTSGLGTATLSNATGATIALRDDSTAGSADIVNNSGGAVYFRDVSTAGNAVITNSGLVTFRGFSTAGDAMIVNSDYLSFWDSSTAGNAAIANDGTVDFAETSGLLDDDKISAGSIAGAGSYDLGDNELTVGSNGRSTLVSGDITGNGSLVKVGTGTLTLSGVNTYIGATTVSGGKLSLAATGDLTASSGVLVDTTGAIGGTGTFASVVVGAGGAIAPGNSIGTLVVAGDVDFDAGSFFDVEVDHLGNADLLDATGTVTIDGGTVRVTAAPGAYAQSTPYTILTANLVTGTFDDVTSSLAFLTPSLSYDTENVFLTLDRNDIAFAEAATTGNQRSVASAAEALGAGNPIYDAILSLTDEEAQAAYEALSGEGHASIKGMLVENSTLVLDALLGRLQTLRSAPETTGAVSACDGEPMLSGESAYAGRLWGQLYGGLGSRAGDGNAAASSFGGGGLVLGTETQIGDWQFGFSAQVGSSGFSIPNRATTGSSADIGLGVYSGTQWGDTGFGFGASFTRSNIATTRQVQFPGFSETLTASYGATTGVLFAEVNHEFELGDVSLAPFAQLAYSGSATDAFTEQGGAAALSSSASLVNSTFTTLGLRAEHEFLFGEDGLASISGGLAWRHGFIAAPVSSNAFAGGTAFAASGAPAGSDALVLEAGLSFDLANGLDVSLDYAGQIAAQGQSHGISARIGGEF